MLHTISNTSIDPNLIHEDDAVIFWQNGVNLTLNNHTTLLAILSKTERCYALDSDILARGLMPFIDERITIIDMQMVVSLTESYYPQFKW